MLFLNHASVLITKGDEYLLCDPWFEKPAFGSWLPNPPLFVHPAYLAALKDKLTILISHAHDDHSDHDFLSLFDRDTKILSSDYASSSVKRRMQQNGFDNYLDIGREGRQVGAFFIRSFRNERYSLDDALYTIRCDEGIIIHGNDNWRAFPPETIAEIKKEVDLCGEGKSIYMSQTNIASGFPVIFDDFTENEKADLLRKHVGDIICSGMENGAAVGARYFHSYAGFAQVFIKGKESYLTQGVFPTPNYIRNNLSRDVLNKIELLDMYPGDVFDFSDNTIKQSIFGRHIYDDAIREATQKYYKQYDIVSQGDSYKEFAMPDHEIVSSLEVFLTGFNEFVESKTQKSDFYPSIIGKIFSLGIAGTDVLKSIEFGKGLLQSTKFNKKIILDKNILKGVLLGEILFESITTGYLGTVYRAPREDYNRDIYIYITMYSYLYAAKFNKSK